MNDLEVSEHLSMVRNSLASFVEKEMPRHLAQQWDKDNHFPREVFDKLVDLGWMGLTVDEAYGGSGRDIVATVAVIEALCSRSMSVGCAYIQSTCYAGLNLNDVASDEQKQKFLPQVASKGLMFAYGISEPDVGSDVASVKTTAAIVDGKVVINGSKRFCSGAAISDYIYTLVRTGPKEDRYHNLSIVLVPPTAAGVILEPQDTMGLKGGGTYDVTFADVEVPLENIVGGEQDWNKGWSKLIGPGLDIEKIEVAAMALGIANAAVNDAWSYSQERVQFGKAICTFQSVRHILAEVKTQLEACRLMVYNSAEMANRGEAVGVKAAMTKLFVCDTSRDIVLKCQQIMGAYGYVKEFDMERYVRDILVMPILGGSSAIQKNNICNWLKLPKK